MRIVFMGTPAFAVPTLDALIAAGHELVAVYSQPPRAAGRGKALRPSPVQERARDAGIEVRTPARLRDAEAQQAFAALDADVGVVAAYGLILPEAVLQAPRSGCINVHASILPRWRGAAPIQRAILAGDDRTGVTIMGMERGLDTGPVYAVRDIPIDRKTAGALGDELGTIGARLMVDVLERLAEITPVAQPDEGVTYAPKIDKQEARLDFGHPADKVERQIRAFNPVPGAWFEVAGERIKLLGAEVTDRAGAPGLVIDDRLSIGCSTGAIVPTMVQRAGRGVMTSVELLRGFSIPPGTRLA